MKLEGKFTFVHIITDLCTISAISSDIGKSYLHFSPNIEGVY